MATRTLPDPAAYADYKAFDAWLRALDWDPGRSRTETPRLQFPIPPQGGKGLRKGTRDAVRG